MRQEACWVLGSLVDAWQRECRRRGEDVVLPQGGVAMAVNHVIGRLNRAQTPASSSSRKWARKRPKATTTGRVGLIGRPCHSCNTA